MRRSTLTFLFVALSVVVLAGQALAFQCPKLVAQITAGSGTRFDAAANDARALANQAMELHKAGKHAEAEKAAKDGLEKLK
jgi:hypothetical protein